MARIGAATILGVALAGTSGVAGQGAPALSGGFTVVGQHAYDARIRSEIVGSLDLFGALPIGRGTLHAYVEANTTPFRRGVSTIIGEANTDAGTALSARRKGRIQISEFKLEWPVAHRTTLTTGLLDVTGSLDVSRIANDENLFFLGVSFVNNPTIEFPDYTLGAILERRAGDRGVGFAAVVASSNGLADNPGVSYVQLLDVVENDKGLFAGGAVRWRSPAHRASVGAWVNTSNHGRLDGKPGTESNAGVYTVLGASRGRHSLSLRLGLADPDVYLAHGFAGLTWLWTRRPAAVGLGAGHTWASASGGDPALGDVTQAEGFARLRLWQELFLTGSAQLIRNSQFDATDTIRDRTVFITGVRLSFVF